MDRGDIYHVDLNPTKGREQAGTRYVLVVTSRGFNQLGTPFICPITQGGNFARSMGFTVSMMGVGTVTQGVVLCNQLRIVDFSARGGRFVEKAPEFIVDDVLARLQALLQ